jgi:hypothetical protein
VLPEYPHLGGREAWESAALGSDGCPTVQVAQPDRDAPRQGRCTPACDLSRQAIRDRPIF